MSIPRALRFDRIRPKGFASVNRKLEISPLSGFSATDTAGYVKFKLDTQDWIDPYQSYIEIEVQLGKNCDYLELDGPSTSLISELLITQDTRELERVSDYDQLGQILTDLNQSYSDRIDKQYQGQLYENSYANFYPDQKPQPSCFVYPEHLQFRQAPPSNQLNALVEVLPGDSSDFPVNNNRKQVNLCMNYSAHGFRPDYCMPKCVKGRVYRQTVGESGISVGTVHSNVYSLTQQNKTVPVGWNQFRFGYSNADFLSYQPLQSVAGPNNNFFPTQPLTQQVDVRTPQAQMQQSMSGFMGSSLSEDPADDPFMNTQLSVRGRYDFAHAMLDSEFGIEAADGINVGPLDFIPDIALMRSLNYDRKFFSCDHMGYNIPFAQGLSGQKSSYMCRQPVLKLVNGSFVRQSALGFAYGENATSRSTQQEMNATPQKQGETFMLDSKNQLPDTARQLTRLKLVVPILSGLIGILIPPSAWKLLPGKALHDLMISLKFNPYAFITSQSNTDNTMPARDFQINSAKIVFDTWSFDSLVQQQMEMALNSDQGLVLSSQSWQSGSQFQIKANTGLVQNNWQLSFNNESIKSVLALFISNEYLQYSYCRKNFRLSMNLQSLQLKAGNILIPTQPIEGQAGNVGLNDSELCKDDNTQFLLNLDKTFGKFFEINRKCQISKLNFAINERPYNPSNSSHTGYGKALFHERRCVGKALFAVNLDSNPDDDNALSGLNSAKLKPFELMIRAPSNASTRDATLITLANFDFYVEFRAHGTKTFGR